jgi:hypothetical protein
MPAPRQRARAAPDRVVGAFVVAADPVLEMEKLAGDDAPVKVLPTISSAGCGLGTFIRAMPCSSNVRSAACCRGLRPIFDERCSCRCVRQPATDPSPAARTS